MSPKRLKNGMKPVFLRYKYQQFYQGASPPESPTFWGPQSVAPKPLPRLFLDPSYGPVIIRMKSIRMIDIHVHKNVIRY